MSAPRVSVLLSVYDGGRFLEESVRSVLVQTCGDFELLIRDDGSRDGGVDRLVSISDPRVSVSKNEKNEGLFSTLNRLARAARAPLLKFWCQDDVMEPELLEKGLAFYARNPSAGCFYAGCATLDERGCVIPPPPDGTPELLDPSTADRYALLHGCLSSNLSNLFVPADVFREAGGFKENKIASDFDLMVRIQASRPVGRLSEALLRVRRHAGQWSRSAGAEIRFLEDDAAIYAELRARLVRNRIMTDAEAGRVLDRKYARNYFHQALRLASRGKPREAAALLRRLSVSASLPRMAGLWFADLPGRMMRRGRGAR